MGAHTYQLRAFLLCLCKQLHRWHMSRKSLGAYSTVPRCKKRVGSALCVLATYFVKYVGSQFMTT